MTTPLTWKNYFRPITNGTDVNAKVTNTPLNDLFANQLYLKQQIDNMVPGKALVISDQIILNTAVVGTSVYLSAANVWTPAIVELSSSPTSSLFTLTPKSYVAGMVLAVGASGRGDIIIGGQATFDASFASRIEGTFTSGIQYLSPYTAGKITSSKGVAPVRVCMAYGPANDGSYKVIVNPDQRVQLESHGHYHFELLDAPAGDPNCVPGKEGFMWGDLEPAGPYPGIVHAVSNPDVTQRGWLPALPEYFLGKTIPAGAAFGYNLALDTDLSAVWPPLPITGVSVEVDGMDEVGDKVEVNSDGIWWMPDAYGKAPWPVNLPCSPQASSSSTTYPIWPIRLDLYFTKTLHGTTVEALNNQIGTMTALTPALTPIVVGEDIDSVMLTSAVHAYQLHGKTAGTSSSSSTPSDVVANSMIYRLDAKEFAVIGDRNPTVAIEVVLGVPSGNAASILEIMNALTVRVDTVPAPTVSAIRPLSDLTTEVYNWDVTPPTATIPSDAYFTLRSLPVTVATREVYYIELTWRGSGFTYPDALVYLIAVRPLVTL